MLVPVLLVLLALTTVAGVLVYRHRRRLRHGVLALVSTRYSARPAAARFTNGDALGELRGPRPAGTGPGPCGVSWRHGVCARLWFI